MSAPEHSTAHVTTHDRPQAAYTTAAARDDPFSHLTGHDPNFLDEFLPYYDPDGGRDALCLFSNPQLTQEYRASPSPPANFLNTILNPAGLDHNRYSPFVYRPSPPRGLYTTEDDMAPNTRARPHGYERPARLPNGYVDLTATPDHPPQRRKRGSPPAGPSAKRQKQDDGSPTERASSESVRVEEVDLTDDKQTVHEVLQKQRLDAIKAQARPEEKATTFNTINCVICMDVPTDLTATACGMTPVRCRDARNC
jgi:hypothetical protein